MNAMATEDVRALRSENHKLKRQLQKAQIIRTEMTELPPVDLGQIQDENHRLKQEVFELGVQVRSYERENAAYQKIIDSIGQACSR